mgnify:CR=1 FL=1
MQTVRTTIEIDRELIKKAKQKAIEEDKSLKRVITEALRKQLEPETPLKSKAKAKKYPFKTYHMGKMKGTLRRVEIYDWL